MTQRFIRKKTKRVYVRPYIKKNENIENNENKKNEVMNQEILKQADEVINKIDNPKQKVKVVKKEKGLIERTEVENVIITEDNRRVLND